MNVNSMPTWHLPLACLHASEAIAASRLPLPHAERLARRQIRSLQPRYGLYGRSQISKGFVPSLSIVRATVDDHALREGRIGEYSNAVVQHWAPSS